MAVDTVQSEPLSGEFPLTGNLLQRNFGLCTAIGGR
jgi:hypothetical protein